MMLQEPWVFAAIQLFITVLVAYDAYKHRDWLTDTQLVSIIVLAFLVPLLGAVLYLISIYAREKKLVECPHCGEAVHMEEDKCPNCGQVRGVEEYHEHEGPYTCDACGKEFDTYRGRREHVATHHDEDDTSDGDDASSSTDGYTCEECGEMFDSERGLHVHQAQAHE